MNLYVVRHGETQFNIEKRYAGQTDVPLNETSVVLVYVQRVCETETRICCPAPAPQSLLLRNSFFFWLC